MSWKQRRPVTEMIGEKLAVTFELGLLSFILAQLISLPIGIISALRQNTLADYVGRSFAISLHFLPQLLGGHDGDRLSRPVVGLPAAGAVDAVPGQPAEEPERRLGAGAGLGVADGRRHDALGTHHDAGSAAPGLHQDRLVEGPRGDAGGGPARAQEHHDPGGHDHGTADTDPDRGKYHHRADLQPAGHGLHDDHRAQHARLSAGQRHHDRPLVRHRA